MKSWILTSNQQYYRVNDALRELGAIEWHHTKATKNISDGDIVYIYISSPVKKIQWKCQVVNSHKNNCDIDDSDYNIGPALVYDGPYIELKVIKEMKAGSLLDYDRLTRYGLKSKLQGPQTISGLLLDYIEQISNTDDITEFEVDDAYDIPLDKLKNIAVNYSQVTPNKTNTSISTYQRNTYISTYAKRKANGICQLCNNPAPFLDKKGNPYLESHHIKWLSKGGTDSIDNTVALCPNCHKKMHIVNAIEDINILIQKAK